MVQDYREILENAKLRQDDYEAFLKKIQSSKSPSQKEIFLVHEEVVKEINCLKCANCCKTTPALVEESEFDNLAAVIGVSRSKFVKEFVELDEDGDFVLNQSPCRFLKSDNKCSIYEGRPKACREYPHTDDKNFKSYLEMNLENTKICPIVVRVLDRLMNAF